MIAEIQRPFKACSPESPVPEPNTCISRLRAPRDGVRGRARNHRVRSFLFTLLLATAIPYVPNTLAQTVLNAKLPVVPPQSQSEPPGSAPSPAASIADRAIPLPQVADQADELDSKLEEISRKLKARRLRLRPTRRLQPRLRRLRNGRCRSTASPSICLTICNCATKSSIGAPSAVSWARSASYSPPAPLNCKAKYFF